MFAGELIRPWRPEPSRDPPEGPWTNTRHNRPAPLVPESLAHHAFHPVVAHRTSLSTTIRHLRVNADNFRRADVSTTRRRDGAYPGRPATPRRAAIASWYCSPCRRAPCWRGSSGRRAPAGPRDRASAPSRRPRAGNSGRGPGRPAVPTTRSGEGHGPAPSRRAACRRPPLPCNDRRPPVLRGHGGESLGQLLPLLHEPGHALLRLLARLSDLAGLRPVAVEIRIGERQPDLLLARFQLLDLRFHRAQADLDRLDLAIHGLVALLALHGFLLQACLMRGPRNGPRPPPIRGLP